MREILKDKKSLCRLGILLGIYVIIVLVLTRFKYAYGSTLDWVGQHYAIPDYFRKLFYDTGEFFPSFAPNIGAGENIYYLSYYGLYSPIILFSYLLPFVKMSTYIQIVSILGVAVDIVLFYIFINRKFSKNTAFIMTLMFELSAPLISHSHRHIMFVNYMPFLILGLMAVEDYFTKGRNVRISVYSFLIILCSYYFSVPALIAMTVYGIYCYLNTHENFKLGEFTKSGLGFALRIIIGIMSAGVLLLPTLAVMLGGRDSSNSDVGLTKLLPKVSLDFIATNNYALGLSLFLIPACMIGILSKDKARRFISIIITLFITCPIFVYILNAGMYIEPKVLIPFIPICIIIIGQAYDDLIAKQYRLLPITIVTAVALVWGLITFDNILAAKIGAYIDSAVLMICLISFMKFRKKAILQTAMLFTLALSTVGINAIDKMPTFKKLNEIDSSEINTLADHAANDEQIARTSVLIQRSNTVNTVYNTGHYVSSMYSSLHNEGFKSFYFDEIKNENEFRNSALTCASKSLLYNILMGEKYMIASKDAVPTGYEKVETLGDVTLYKNDRVLPIGYVSHELMSEAEYRKLEYPQSIEALSKYVIIPDDVDSGYSSKLEECKLSKLEPNSFISNTQDGYHVFDDGMFERIDYLLERKYEMFERTIKLEKPLKKDQVMLLRFNVDNSEMADNNDVKIIVNDIQNKLTTPSWKYFNHNNSFEYVITTNGKDELDSLEFEFSKGAYKISPIEAYIMDYPDVSEEVDALRLDKQKTHGDIIEGTVNCTQDGWFNISIPYDKGFEITVDGKAQDYSKTNTAFIGFPMNKGEHKISIRFNAPLLKEGKFLSLFGIVAFIVMTAVEFVLKKKKA